MKKVLITGVGKGIGQALAQKFLDEGYVVIGTTLSGSSDFEDRHFSCYRLDLSSPKSISACAEKVRKAEGKIDILINNAGVLLDEEETSVKPGILRKTLEVNLIGTIDFTEHIIPFVRTRGHIVNISSTAGSLALTSKNVSHHPHHYPAYKISKTALNMYTRTLAQALKNKGIAVSSVHPGWVKTDMGGADADITPQKAAKQIFDFAVTHPATGNFWYAGKKLPW